MPITQQASRMTCCQAVRARVVRVRRQQEQREGRHQGKRGHLAPPQDVDARCPQGGQQHGQQRHEQFANEGRQREPPRHSRRRRHAQQADNHEDAVGHRVDDLADLGDLVQPAREVAVDPVGGAEDAEQPRRDRSVIGREEDPEEDRQQPQTNHGDQVRPRPPSGVAVRFCAHRRSVLLRDGDGLVQVDVLDRVDEGCALVDGTLEGLAARGSGPGHRHAC